MEEPVPPYLRCQQERQRRRWTQADVANHPEIRKVRPRLYQTDISDIELGRRIPTPDQVAALGSALGVSPASALLEPVFVKPVEQLA